MCKLAKHQDSQPKSDQLPTAAAPSDLPTAAGQTAGQDVASFQKLNSGVAAFQKCVIKKESAESSQV